MATLYDCEGADISAATLFTSRGWDNNPDSVVTGLLGRGRAMRISSTNAIKTKTLIGAPYTTLVMGVRVLGSVITAGQDFLIMRVGSTSIARVNIASGVVQIRNSGGTILATGTTIIGAGETHYYELKAFVNGASGTVELRLDGVAEVASTVGNIGSTGIDGGGVARPGTSGNGDIDDIYFASDFLGDVEIFTGFPTADGANAAATPDTGVTHYTRVNEATGTFPDGDTSYVKDNTPGDRETYPVTTLPISSGSVFGFVINAYARKDDSGARTLDGVGRQAGVNYDKADVKGLSIGYTFKRWVYSTDPAGGAPTISNMNADEYGVKFG